MKIIYKYVGILSTALFLTSCLKDKNVENQSYGLINKDANKIVELPSSLTSLALPIRDKDTTINLFSVNLAAKEVSEEDLTVSLSIDKSNEIIDHYNEENEASIVPFPSDLYSLISGLTVTIPKGSKKGDFKIVVNSSKFDLANTYALGLYLKSVDKNGVLLSGNFDTIMVKIAAKNRYDGVYTNNGYSLRATDNVLTGFFSDKSRELSTTGANSVTYAPLWGDGKGEVGGISGTTITVNPITNKVTMSSDNPALVNLPSYDNRYDPETKTFYLSYYWGNGPSHRAKTDTLIYSSVRP